MDFLDSYKILDSTDNVDQEYLKHLALSGKGAYASQGFTGKGSIIGVIDTGVNPNHIALKDKIEDIINYTGYGKGYDDNGHGSHVSGTIAGTNIGIAEDSRIVSFKALDGAGGGNFNNVIKAVEEAKDWKNRNNERLTAVSMSLSANKSQLSASSIAKFEKAIKALTDSGIAVICSAGNSGKEEVRYPAYFSDPITVGAIEVENFEPAGFSTSSKEVDVCQVGVDILSCWKDNSYKVLSGTSMATPVVSGITALIAGKFKSLFKEYIPEETLYWMLKMNTKDVGIKGLDKVTGAGFCSLQPLVMDMWLTPGDDYVTVNKNKVPLYDKVHLINDHMQAEIRGTFERACMGLVEYYPEIHYGRVRL